MSQRGAIISKWTMLTKIAIEVTVRIYALLQWPFNRRVDHSSMPDSPVLRRGGEADKRPRHRSATGIAETGRGRPGERLRFLSPDPGYPRRRLPETLGSRGSRAMHDPSLLPWGLNQPTGNVVIVIVFWSRTLDKLTWK